MNNPYRTFKADSFDEAYRLMVRELGRDAVVINSKEIREGGILGIRGRKKIELTASAAKPAAATATMPDRRRSLPEKRYQAQHAGIGSDETMSDTVAFFRKVVSEAQARMTRQQAQPGAAPAPLNELQREIHEMRRLLQVLVAEQPGSMFPPEFAVHYRALLAQGMCRELAAQIVNTVIDGGDRDILRNPVIFRERMKLDMQRRIRTTGGLDAKKGLPKRVALIGATGVGKTTNLAKLAAQYAVGERLRVAFLTTDTYRIAAPEQLNVYAQIIGTPMKIANNGAEFAKALKELTDYDLVLIDTAGGSQFNMPQIEELRTTLAAGKLDEIGLVLSANTQLEELRSAVQSFSVIGPTSLLFSKLDETRRFGALYTIAAETNLPLSYFSIGQNVPDDIELAGVAKVARLVASGGGSTVGSGT